jgi:hypothetical protein
MSAPSSHRTHGRRSTRTRTRHVGGTRTPKQFSKVHFAQIQVSRRSGKLDHDGRRRFVASGAPSRCAHRILLGLLTVLARSAQSGSMLRDDALAMGSNRSPGVTSLLGIVGDSSRIRLPKGGHGLAQAIVLICDQCGKPDASTITIRAGSRSFVKDLCSGHLQALLKDTRAPRRGRPKVGTASSGSAAPKVTGRKRRGTKPAARSRATKKTSSRKASRTALSR